LRTPQRGIEGGGREGCSEVGTGGAMDGGRETGGGRREIDRYLVREGWRRERRSDGGRDERREGSKYSTKGSPDIPLNRGWLHGDIANMVVL